MQCPRCYFTNQAGSRVCDYCGARLDATVDVPAPDAGSAVKRRTMLGPAPKLEPVAPRPPEPPADAKPPLKVAPRPRIDPDDPFRIAAQGAVPLAPPATAPPAAPTLTPPPTPPEPRKPAARQTVITAPQPSLQPVAGVALVIEADGEARALVLREGRTRVGRRSDAEIPLTDERASHDHALIRVEGGRAWLLDTSANGTVVSGVPCVNDRADLVDGAVLEIGGAVVVLKLLGEDSLALLARSR